MKTAAMNTGQKWSCLWWSLKKGNYNILHVLDSPLFKLTYKNSSLPGLHQGLSEPKFYGDLVYKFKKIVGRVDFSDQFRKIIVRYKRIGYNINIMRQSACLVFNPITVNNFASLFNCTPVGRASDSAMAST